MILKFNFINTILEILIKLFSPIRNFLNNETSVILSLHKIQFIIIYKCKLKGCPNVTQTQKLFIFLRDMKIV